MSFVSKLVGRKDQLAQTPDEIYRLVFDLFGIPKDQLYDPCPSNPDCDGLAVPWQQYTYVNPPFGRTHEWMKKAILESERGDVFCILLIPFRPAKYWIGTISRASNIVVLNKSTRFKGYAYHLPVPMMVVTFGKQPRDSPLLKGTIDLPRIKFEMFDTCKAIAMEPGMRSFMSSRGIQCESIATLCDEDVSKEEPVLSDERVVMMGTVRSSVRQLGRISRYLSANPRHTIYMGMLTHCITSTNFGRYIGPFICEIATITPRTLADSGSPNISPVMVAVLRKRDEQLIIPGQENNVPNAYLNK